MTGNTESLQGYQPYSDIRYGDKNNSIADIHYSHAYQPIIDIECGEIISYESLLRGINRESPQSVFEQVPEEKLMDFNQIIREHSIKLASSLKLNCSLNLNFSPSSILYRNGKYVKDTIKAAQNCKVETGKIIIEITESQAIKDPKAFLEIINMARSEGLTIAIDDFGVGYAGLNLLADLQPDIVKIDMYLLRNIEQHGAKQSIVKSICSVCFDLGIDILAEGVETVDEFDFLRSLGITVFQGFLFSEPGFEELPSVSAKYLTIQ